MKNEEYIARIDEALRGGGFKNIKRTAESLGVERSDVDERLELFRAEVHELLDSGTASSEIAEVTGSTIRIIAAFRAARTQAAHRREEEADEAIEVTAGLERDLQNAIRANITHLDPELSIIDGGKERTTAAGRIDITCADKNGVPVVIELKVGRAKDAAIGQILGYMGALTEEESKTVRGILIAEKFDDRTIYAARFVPNLTLKTYVMRFNFQDIT